MAPARFTGPRAAVTVAVPASSATSMIGKKPRKPRAPKEKPPGMSNAQWIAEKARLEAENLQRRTREKAQRQRQLAAHLAEVEAQAAEEEEEEEEKLDEPPTPAASAAPPVKRRGGLSPSPHPHPFAGWSQTAAASPSPSPLWNASPHYSPGYADADPHGGFNPNYTFPHHPPMMYVGSPGYASSSSLRRALPFTAQSLLGGMPQDLMDEIITTGSMASAACPGFLSQGGEFFSRGGGDYGQGASGAGVGMDTGTEEADAGAEEGDETAPAGAEGARSEDGDTGGRRPRKASKVAPKPPVKPRIKWTSREDILLVEAWKTISLDPIVGANQALDNYWKRVKMAYDERRMIDPDFASCVTERGQKAMANHWAHIQAQCNKWHGIQQEVTNMPQSGTNREMEIVRMLEAFKDDEKTDFKFLHVFVVIEGCEKWAETRRSIGKGKEYVPDAAAAGASDGRPPMGHKKAKAARDAAPTAAKLEASIQTCLADAQAHAAKREDTANKRWAALMANSQVKIDLLRTSTVAKKRNHDLAFLTVGDPAAMDPEVRTWFMAQRRLILSDIVPAPAPTPTDTSYATPADTPCDSPTSSVSPAETPPAQPTSAAPTAPIDLANAETAATAIDLESAPPVIDLEATPSSAPAPTTTPIVDADSDAEASPASI